jgi:hypothetical protein
MKTRLAVILILAAVAVVAIVLIRFPAPESTPPPSAVPPPAPAPSSAREAVVAYLEALYRKDFRAAYEHLSAGSQEAHPYDEFLKLCEKGEATNFDLAAAEELRGEDGRVVVTVPLVEDPAEAGFTMVNEDGRWKVVFTTGVPWFPYP